MIFAQDRQNENKWIFSLLTFSGEALGILFFKEVLLSIPAQAWKSAESHTSFSQNGI